MSFLWYYMIHLKKKPKLNHEAFEDYLLDVLNEIDISTLKEEYDRIITSVK